MYFPKTNCKKKKKSTFPLHSVVSQMEVFPSSEIWLRIVESTRKCAWAWEKYFEVVFSSFYFKWAKETQESYFLVYVSKKKSDQKGQLQLIFLLERNKGRRVGLCSRPSGYFACQLDANDLFWKADFTPKEILKWGTSTHWSVCEGNFISGFWRPVYM